MTPKPIFFRPNADDIRAIEIIAAHLDDLTMSTPSKSNTLRYALRWTASGIDPFDSLPTLQPERNEHDRQPHAAQDEPQQYQPPE